MCDVDFMKETGGESRGVWEWERSVCVREVIGVSSMLRLIRRDMILTRMLSTLDLTELGVENNVRWWKRNQSWL